jgi:filamentous hemagglutinin
MKPQVSSDGKTLVSTDQLKQYRPPTFKPKQGKVRKASRLSW